MDGWTDGMVHWVAGQTDRECTDKWTHQRVGKQMSWPREGGMDQQVSGEEWMEG